jgi:hypothetical protein
MYSDNNLYGNNNNNNQNNFFNNQNLNRNLIPFQNQNQNFSLPLIPSNNLSPNIYNNNNNFQNQYNQFNPIQNTKQSNEQNFLENQQNQNRGNFNNPKIPPLSSGGGISSGRKIQVQNTNTPNIYNNNLDNEFINNNNNLNSSNSISNSPFDLNFIMQEFSNFKRTLKNLAENQNDFQNRLIDNSKILQDQESLIRLSNIKMNEHDSKLTEILLTFNNFMNFNEKTNKIIKELTNKYDEAVERSELNDTKMQLFNLIKNNETKITEIFNKQEDSFLKYSELKQEQDIFQKYTLEKLKNYQNESMENRILQQQQLIKLEESREIKFNQQIEQIKILIKNQEQNFTAENFYRKSAMENMRSELIENISQFEEKINLMQKSSLEMEKKILDNSKEYIITFNELISQNNQNLEIEIRSLKNIFTNNLIKSDKKTEENLSNLNNQFKGLADFMEKNRNSIDNLEKFCGEKINIHEKSFKNNEQLIEIMQKDAKNMNKDIENLNTELNKIINKRFNILNEEIQEKVRNQLSELNENYNEMKNNHIGIMNENKDKIDIFTNRFNNLLSEINTKIERKLKDIDVEDINFDSKINEKFGKVREENEDFKKKLLIMVNNYIDDANVKSNFKQEGFIEDISNKLDNKIEYLKKELHEEFKDDFTIREGNLQKGIFQTEEKLYKTIEDRIVSMQLQIDNLSDKFL